MAQLNVEPKKKNNSWIWLVVIIVILLAWYLLQGRNGTMNDSVNPMSKDSTTIMDDTM